MDWMLSEMEAQEHAWAVWRQAASIVLTDDVVEIVEVDAPAGRPGKEKGAVGRPALRPDLVQKP